MKIIKTTFLFLISSVLFISLSVSASALFGDVNNDDYIGVEDAVLILKFTAGLCDLSEEAQQNGDLDYDGNITTADARLILRGAGGIDYVADHSFTKWETLLSPTCTEDGVAVCHCLYCDKEIKKLLPKTGHTVVAATCTEPSYCSVCYEILSKPNGHNENAGYCSLCGKLLASPTLTYKGKEIVFACSTDELVSSLGKPNNVHLDKSAPEPVSVYVYYTDYTDLGIFTFTGGKLTQFYSNNSSSSISHGNASYCLNDSVIPENIGDISLSVYSDSFNQDKVYCFCATVGKKYNLKETSDYSVNAKLNFHLTNGLRAINGVPVLKYSSAATRVAIGHSTDMANRNFFSHENPDGKRVDSRLTDGGIEWRACAENIVAGYYDPYAIANGWYNSQSHRKNILNKNYKYLGVGYAYNESSDYRYYGTQNFYTDE